MKVATPFIFLLLLSSVAFARDINITVNVTTPPPPPTPIQVLGLTGFLAGIGTIIFSIKVLLFSPKDWKELLITLTIITVVSFVLAWFLSLAW